MLLVWYYSTLDAKFDEHWDLQQVAYDYVAGSVLVEKADHEEDDAQREDKHVVGPVLRYHHVSCIHEA